MYPPPLSKEAAGGTQVRGTVAQTQVVERRGWPVQHPASPFNSRERPGGCCLLGGRYRCSLSNPRSTQHRSHSVYFTGGDGEW